MQATKTIDMITVRWDDQPGVKPGWYCETWDAEGVVDDSQKVWFPVLVDKYTREEAEQLREELAEAFPFAEIKFD